MMKAFAAILMLVTIAGCATSTLDSAIYNNRSVTREFEPSLDGVIIAKSVPEKINELTLLRVPRLLSGERQLVISLPSTNGAQNAILTSEKASKATTEILPASLENSTEMFVGVGRFRADVPHNISFDKNEVVIIFTKKIVFIGDAIEFGARPEIVGREVVVVSGLGSHNEGIYRFTAQHSASKEDKKQIEQIANNKATISENVSWQNRSYITFAVMHLGYLGTVIFDAVTSPIQLFMALNIVGSGR